MSDISTAKDELDAARLIDVDVGTARSAGLGYVVGMLVCVIGSGVLALVASDLGANDLIAGLVVLVSLFGMIMGGQHLASVSFQRVVTGLVERRRDEPLANLFGALFDCRTSVNGEERLVPLARALAAAGRVGETIRNCSQKYATPVVPITVPFKPHPLNEPDAFLTAVDRLMADHAHADPLGPDALEGSRTAAAEPSEPNIRSGLGWLWSGLAVVPATGIVMHTFLRGNTTWLMIFLGVCGLCVLLALAHVLGVMRGRQWIVVPGGLVRREPCRTKSAWELHLFDRRRSVLIIHRGIRGFWFVGVADANAASRLSATDTELNFLLRAWLSPLPPPPVEQLTDLT